MTTDLLARVAFARLKEEMASLERGLLARERELSSAAQPKQVSFTGTP